MKWQAERNVGSFSTKVFRSRAANWTVGAAFSGRWPRTRYGHGIRRISTTANRTSYWRPSPFIRSIFSRPEMLWSWFFQPLPDSRSGIRFSRSSFIRGYLIAFIGILRVSPMPSKMIVSALIAIHSFIFRLVIFWRWLPHLHLSSGSRIPKLIDTLSVWNLFFHFFVFFSYFRLW